MPLTESRQVSISHNYDGLTRGFLLAKAEMLLGEECSTHQNEDCEEYDDDCSGNEELFPGKHSSRKEKDQCKADGPSEPSIGNDELVLKGQGNCPEPVNGLSQDKDT